MRAVLAAVAVAITFAIPARAALAAVDTADNAPATIIRRAADHIREGHRAEGARLIVAVVESDGSTPIVWLAVRELWSGLDPNSTDGILEESLTRIFRDPRWRDEPELAEERWLAAMLPADRALALIEAERYSAAAEVLEAMADVFPEQAPEALRRAILARAMAGDLDGGSRDADHFVERWPGVSLVTDASALVRPGDRFWCGTHAGLRGVWW